MVTLMEEAVKIDVELFDLIALSYKNRKSYKKAFKTRVNKFIKTTDQITGCLLVVAMPSDLITELVSDMDMVRHIVRFTKTHSIPKVYNMLEVRYSDELNRLKLRIGTAEYDNLISLFERNR